MLCFICFLSFMFGASASSLDAGVNIDIGVSAPPPLQSDDRPDAHPDFIVVPGGTEYVYMLPDMSGVYFYHGMWYRFYKDAWFRAAVYNGEWLAVPVAAVPVVIVNMPPEYPFYVPKDYYRIRYHDALVRWKEWERIRHWNHYDWYKHELRADVVEERHHAIEEERSGRRVEGRHSIEDRPALEGRQTPDVRNLNQAGGPEHSQQRPHVQPYLNKLPRAVPQVQEQGKQPRPGLPHLQKPGLPPQKPVQTQPGNLLKSQQHGQLPEKLERPQPEAKPQPHDQKQEEKKKEGEK